MRTVEYGKTGPVSAARRAAGMFSLSSCHTAVLSVMTAATRSWLRAAQVSDSTPPQSCPSVTRGWSAPEVVDTSAVNSETTASKSATRCAMRRCVGSSPRGVGRLECSMRSEYPISSWSGAMTRQVRAPGSPAVSTVAWARRRHRYDHVGFPCRATIVPVGSKPRSRNAGRVSRTWNERSPSKVGTVTTRDH